MNDEEIERRLRDLPVPELPESWRGGILATARREVQTATRKRREWPPILPWLRHAFARNPFTATALTFLWVLILLFRMATPHDPGSTELVAQRDSNRPVQVVSLAEEMRLVEFTENEPDRRPPMP
jgi:hypothetical protein